MQYDMWSYLSPTVEKPQTLKHDSWFYVSYLFFQNTIRHVYQLSNPLAALSLRTYQVLPSKEPSKRKEVGSTAWPLSYVTPDSLRSLKVTEVNVRYTVSISKKISFPKLSKRSRHIQPWSNRMDWQMGSLQFNKQPSSQKPCVPSCVSVVLKPKPLTKVPSATFTTMDWSVVSRRPWKSHSQRTSFMKVKS